ncbi:DnaA regulatory inactivator Hda [Polynucleobacter sp. IMCC 30228]|uniref:DnaA regulatory inactivator Hda n=1 Tax=Polynucleobacter sp. IMCC 30228 TaxID=2781011 RepID=UPI001F26966A|nr:DnaA regulatory inactivator Hda [Polynucleobacter sp. IMCC 30228]MCE7526660.1 DnaA regulatory inactivator Hda [Polynucleobacter sp. IMCC 30228]
MKPNAALPKQFALDLSQPQQATLNNFLAASNAALLAHLQSLVSGWEINPADTSLHALNDRWLYWWGALGSGRTHLLSALNNAADLLNLRHFSLQANEPVSWVNLEEKLPHLLSQEQAIIITVDDVDQLDERLSAALFRILNLVHGSRNLYIFMAGNSAPAGLQLREDLRTRLAWGLVFQVQPLSDEEKMQALQQAAAERGLNLSPEVIPWLLQRFYRDMPNLMALLDALDAYSLEMKRAVTLPLVRELLQIQPPTTNNPTLGSAG